MAQSICHIDFGAVDVKKTAEFYQSVFNWKFDNQMGDDYLLFNTGEGLGGGLYKTPEVKPGGGILFYILVDDIQTSLSSVAKAGGRQVTGKTEIPNVGWFAKFSDPAGNVVGLFTPKQ